MIKKSEDIRLKALPVLIGCEHLYYYEGPCRFASGDALQPGYDKFANEERYKSFVTEIKEHLPEGIDVMEPVRLGTTDNWDDNEQQWDDAAPAIRNADVLLMTSGIGCDELVIECASRFQTPMVYAPGPRFSATTISAAIKARPGTHEFYASYKWDDFAQQMRVLRARKIVQSLRVLCATRTGDPTSMSGVDSIRNYDEITYRLGVRFHFISAHELLDQMTPAQEGGNPTTPGRKTWDLTEEDDALAHKMADELLDNAVESDMDRELAVQEFRFFVTVQKQLDVWDCNGFSIPCPDMCSTRRYNELKITPCMVHTLNLESGIPSGCEYDVCAVVSQKILMAVSGQRPYTGNTAPVAYENGKLTERGGAANIGEELDRQYAELGKIDPKNLYLMHHSVAHRCLRSPDEKSPYGVKSFAFDQKFGVTLRHDFDADKGQKITLCRMSPDGTKLFIGSGEIVLGGGMHAYNCSQIVYFRVNDQKDFFDKQCYCGNHLSMVYGDYVDDLKMLAAMFGMEPLVS